MKAGILCVLLVAACSDSVNYEYSVTWTCLAIEGCQRMDEVGLYDRLNVLDDTFVFTGSRNPGYLVTAQRFGSESLPDGCFWLYGLALFGDESEPAKVCHVSGGFDMEIAIPDRNPATNSLWLARARELGWL